MDPIAAGAPPRSLFAWPTFLWSRVLFPGASPGGDEPRRSPFGLLILLFVPALLLYPCLSFPLFEPDESRYAEIPREMLQRGDWITPRLARRAVSRQAAAALLADGRQLPPVRRPRLGGPTAAGPGRSRLRLGAVLLRPAQLRRARGVSRGADAGPGAGLREHRPTAAARRPADVLDDPGPVRRVRGGARRPAAPGLVAAVGRGVRPRRPHQGAGRPGAAGAAAVAAPLADRPSRCRSRAGRSPFSSASCRR